MPASAIGRREFIALLAMSMSLTALGIDILLPAFPEVRADLGLPMGSTDVATLITGYFVGLGVGGLLYGPVSDRLGRRPALLLGYAIYAIGALAAILAPTLELMVLARVVWGFGAAGPRVVTLAAVRDRYEGDQMARAMSFIMAIFILVPVVAPTLGAVIVANGPWRWTFGACLVGVALLVPWASLRMPETLAVEDRLPLQASRLGRAVRTAFTTRLTIGYSMALTTLYAVFMSYLGSSEVIVGETFGLADAYPLIFGLLAGGMGVAILVNARIVERVGARRLGHTVLVVYLVVATIFAGASMATGGRPPLAVFLVCVGLLLACNALLIPNFNSIAMQPMGEIAGTASSAISSVQIVGGAVLGSVLDRQFDGTVLPLSLGFLGFGLVAAMVVVATDRANLFAPVGGRHSERVAETVPV